MAGSPYASALGRLKAHLPEIISRETWGRLVAAKDIGEVTKILEGTPYGPAIVQYAATYNGVPLLQAAINRTFVQRNRDTYEGASFAGKPIVGAYLRKWDIENISLVLSSKVQGRPVTEMEGFLVSSRVAVAGLFAGPMTLDEFRHLLDQPTAEAVVSELVRFGYGSLLLPLLEEFNRTKNIFPLIQVLEKDYYARLWESLKFFQGDEWVVREFLQGEIDARNVLLLIKGKDASQPAEAVEERWIEGGTLARSTVQELYSARDVPELVKTLEPKFPSLAEGVAAYRENRSRALFEAAVQRDRVLRELRRMRAYPLSLAILFTYLLLAETERADLRHTVHGKVYALPPDQIESILVLPRI